MSKFALLLTAGFLILVPSISAQEEPASVEEEISDNEEEILIDERRAELTAIETELSFDTSQSDLSSGTSTWAIIRMVLVLALVAAAVYGIVFLFKKSSKKSAANDDPFLKVLASSHLGANRYVHVVSVGGKAWLVGAGETSVNMISEIEDKDTINAMLLEESKKSSEAAAGRLPDFLGILRKMGAPLGNRGQSADEIRKRRERLKGL